MDTPRCSSTLRGCIPFVLGAFLVLPLIATAAGPENPHWRKGDCQACHSEVQPVVGAAALKSSPGHTVCGECHEGRNATVCRHRSGITPDAGQAEKFDDSLKPGLVDGAIVCTTCHDMTPHCALDVKQRYRNTSFLRGGPFEDTSQQCFSCHGKSGYRQKTPHMHIRKGEIVEGPCIFCHQDVPQKNESGQWESVAYGTDEPLSTLCTGCHAIGPHPSSSISGKPGWIHMVAPSWEYAKRMEQSVAERGGSLPLDPVTGAITCTTCHNPHDRRLDAYPWAGEKTKTRLRYENICGVCHEK